MLFKHLGTELTKKIFHINLADNGVEFSYFNEIEIDKNQEQVNEMFSHINSYVRESKKDKTPYDMVSKKFGKSFLDTIGIRRIPNKLVVLKQIIY